MPYRSTAFLLSLATAATAIYPSGHWQKVKQLNSRNFETVIQQEVDAGNTDPAWNKITDEFKNVDGIVFGDVNWSEEHYSKAFKTNQGPGDGGWPTIRYFNKGTGYGGKGYKQKTDEALDAELGNEEKMRDYVQEKSGVSSCDVVWGASCSEMELKYIDKWVGASVTRSKDSIAQEKEKWDQEFKQPQVKNFAQNKQRIMILGRLLDKFGDPEL